ncbi:MAG: Minf_1886 family protein [Planctomycetota bacterium]
MSEELDLRAILHDAGGYALDSYRFIRDGLAHTVDGLAHTVEFVHGHEEPTHDEHSSHVNGRQLCIGLRDFAIRQYGGMAKTVLNHWGISRTDDFGNIVFAMVDAGLMRKTDEDDLTDFHAVFDFDEEFALPSVEVTPSAGETVN